MFYELWAAGGILLSPPFAPASQGSLHSFNILSCTAVAGKRFWVSFFWESAVFHQAAVGPWIPGNMVHGGWSSEVVLPCQQCKIMKMGPSHTVGWSGTTWLHAQLCANCFSSSSNTVSTMGRSEAWTLQALLWARAQDSGIENAQSWSHKEKVYSFSAEKSYKSSNFTSLSLFQMIGSGPTGLMEYVNQCGDLLFSPGGDPGQLLALPAVKRRNRHHGRSWQSTGTHGCCCMKAVLFFLFFFLTSVAHLETGHRDIRCLPCRSRFSGEMQTPRAVDMWAYDLCRCFLQLLELPLHERLPSGTVPCRAHKSPASLARSLAAADLPQTNGRKSAGTCFFCSTHP